MKTNSRHNTFTKGYDVKDRRLALWCFRKEGKENEKEAHFGLTHERT